MNCKKCGAYLKPGTFFCTNCGTQNNFMSEEATILLRDNPQTIANPYNEHETVYSDTNQWNAPQPQPPQPKKNNAGPIVAVVILSVIVLAGAAAVIGYFVGSKDGNSNEQTTKEQTVEVVVQDEEVTEAAPETTTGTPETTAQRTTSAPTVNQQTVPTFTYNDNNTQSSQFLFDSANQYITRSYLSTCTRDEITIILNEMYARHGYIFKDAELREYFNSQSWYVGYTTSMEEAASYFNKVESANLNTIYEYMKDMGWR